MKPTTLAGLMLLAAVSCPAEPDVAALQRDQLALDQRNTRENQRIDQAQEEAMIPVRAKVRELKAKAERESRAAALALASAIGAGNTDLDVSGVEKARLAELEADNLAANRIEAEAMAPFENQRAVWARQLAVEKAKVDARLFDGIEGGEKAREQTIRKAEIMAQWDEKLVALDQEQQRAQWKLQFELNTRINRAESRLLALGAKAAAALQARVQQKMQKGEMPTAADATPQPDPGVPAVEAERDEARNALQTALEKLQAEFTPRRNEIENQRDAELARLGS